MMRIDNLKYCKGISSKSVSSSSDFPLSSCCDDKDESGGLMAASDYSKGTPYISTKIIFILSGGSKRERDYFKPLKTDSQIHNVKIAFRSKKGQGLKPYELNALGEDFVRAKSFIDENNNSFHIEKGDLIYLLQDVDEFGAEVKKLISKQPNSSAVRWIISNPSFEIWLYFHHSDDVEKLSLGLKLSERDRSNWLKEYMHTLIPGGVKTTQIFLNVETAVRNSRKNYRDNDGFPEVYSTQMHQVAESIISAMGNEFSQMRHRFAEKASFYKKLSSSGR